MNFLQRGFISIIRKPVKTLILFGVIFLLGNIIAGAIFVRQAVDNTGAVLREKMSPAVTMSMILDQEQMTDFYDVNSGFSPESLSVESIEKIGALPYVKYFDYSIGTTLESRTLNRFGGEAFGAALLTPFSFQGVNNPDFLDLKEGNVKLVSGRLFNEQETVNLSYVVLISQSVADINGISVGSRVGFETNVIHYDVDGTLNVIATRQYEFEVIGIYEPVKRAGKACPDWMEAMRENRMYAPNKVLYEINTFQCNEYAKQGIDYSDLKDYAPLFILKDMLDFDKFREAAVALAPDYYEVMGSADEFDQVAAPVKSMQDIATVVLYVAIAATVIVLSLLITLFLRDRHHEIGVLLSLGERKVKIAAQIGLEVIVVAVVAVTLSLFSGNILSGNLSEKMLIDQIAAEQAQNDGFSWPILEMEIRGYQLKIDSDDIVESYAVSPDPLTVFLFYAISVGTICVSVLIPVVDMIRLNPRRIMM